MAREEGFPEECRQPKSEERAARVLPCRTLYITLRRSRQWTEHDLLVYCKMKGVNQRCLGFWLEPLGSAILYNGEDYKENN